MWTGGRSTSVIQGGESIVQDGGTGNVGQGLGEGLGLGAVRTIIFDNPVVVKASTDAWGIRAGRGLIPREASYSATSPA